MDLLYTTILNLLNSLIPSAQLGDFEGLNEIMAYIITIAIIYGAFIRPILKLIKVVK